MPLDLATLLSPLQGVGILSQDLPGEGFLDSPGFPPKEPTAIVCQGHTSLVQLGLYSGARAKIPVAYQTPLSPFFMSYP